MSAALSVALFILIIALHEIGHVAAMLRRGILIEEFGIGFPIPGLPRPKWKIRWQGTSILVSLNYLLIGAFVRPTEDGWKSVDKLPYRDQAMVFGSGILMNLGTAIVLVVLLRLLMHGLYLEGMFTVFLGCFSLAILWYGRHAIAMYVLPAMAVVALALVGYEIFSSPESGFVGPIGIGKIAMETSGIRDSLIFGLGLSLGMALFNVLPFPPLDGGRVWTSIIKRYSKTGAAVLNVVGTLLVLAILFGSCVHDCYK